jgi:phosphoglycerol transferase MdoB-like AlkP superfamily enzyme
MKEKILRAACRYIVINLAFLPLLPVLRVVEYFLLRSTPDFPKDAFQLEFLGLLHDLFSFTVFAFFMFIPFFLLFSLNRKTGESFYIALLCILTIIQIGIIKLFSITLAPLDEVIFSFSLKEIMLIIRSSDDLNLISFLPMIFSILLLIVLQILFRKVTVKKGLPWFIAGFAVATLLFSLILPSGGAKDETEFNHNLKINKCGYFVSRSIASLFSGSSAESSEKVLERIEKYHAIHNEFNFTGNNYPLLHTVNTPDALGPFFKLSPRPPNLVFIIVESLSSACMGDSSWFGNFTPFLDSLTNHSLYWDNFLSTSERTFHVLQALFGSLPYGTGEFQKDMAVMPNHFSLIRTLRENGYYSGFYYGGDATFTNYDQFLKKQGLNFFLSHFGPKYEKMLLEDKNFKWGYQDEALFERSMEVLDSLKKEPRMDIYLTLSTHFPFHPPRAVFYLDQVQKILDQQGFPMNKRIRSARFKELFSSLLYTDDALRSLIKAYSKRDDFNNTIFFITGDHSFIEFGNSTISAIEHYHVPMIIYSPMLKETRHFRSVSSHLDVAPSVMAMLGPVYNLKTEKYSHWLGQGIDTTAGFRNVHTQAFTRKSNKTVDYLKNDFFYADDLLYKIGEGLKTIAVNDNQKRQELRDELSSTVTVYNYTNQNNLLVPSTSIMPARQGKESIRSFDDNTLKITLPGQMFLNLMSPTELRSDYLKLYVDIRLRYMITAAADTANLPVLAASIEDINFKKSLYHLLKFPGISSVNVKPGIWYSEHLNESMDVSMIDSLKGKYLKLYFYYHNSCGIQFDSTQVHLSGTK